VAQRGALTGKLCRIRRIVAIAGPRAGALEVYVAGLEAGRLMRALSRDDGAVLRQTIPWRFAGEPAVYLAERALRVEAGWPPEMAESLIRLSELNRGRPQTVDGRWVAGKSECGALIVPSLNDQTPHFLVSGATGSGKSVTLRAAALQLSADRANRLVLLDGKFGESLRWVAHLRGVVGPVATDGPGVRAALGWVALEMRRRYESGQRDGRLIVLFDEFQQFVDDAVVVALLKKLTAQGRAASVHCLLATQHPTVDAFGDAATRRNLPGKLALYVSDPDASRVAVGGNLPRADFLLGAGDCYAVTPRATHRLQAAYVDERDVGQAEQGRWQLEAWPEYCAADLGQDLPVEAVSWSYSGAELGASLVAAAQSPPEGRRLLQRRLEEAGLGRPGSDRADRLLGLGREAHRWLLEGGWAIAQP